jgi:hypothetical protein
MGDELSNQQKASRAQTKGKAPTRLISSVGLDRAVLKAGAEIRERYRDQLSDRATAERVARLFRARLIPRGKPGAGLSKSVAIALPMRQYGEQWQDIYEAALPGYRAMDKYERHLRTTNLRGNVRKALARRRAKPREDSPPVQNALGN